MDKPKTHQTVIIFDWDDTLLCTSYLDPASMDMDAYKGLSKETKDQLKTLEKAAVKKSN